MLHFFIKLRSWLEEIMAHPSIAGLIFGFSLVTAASAADFSIHVPMHQNGKSTYYVMGSISPNVVLEFLVDTGSGYATITDDALATLKTNGRAKFVKELRAVTADEYEMIVPVYRIATLKLGENCVLHDIDAAVLPGSTRNILGLSALTKAEPFAIRTSPATLMLSTCG
jgi:predicted aspartyl protease